MRPDNTTGKIAVPRIATGAIINRWEQLRSEALQQALKRKGKHLKQAVQNKY